MYEETKKILITVKAYPNPSKKYGETVCVAGIDIENNKWIRLYPIPYRDLDEDKKFKKYNIIEVKVDKPTDDKRPESYKVNTDSIKVLDYLDTSNKWDRRKRIVLSTLDKSMCEILRKSRKDDKSLGVFKPRCIDFECLKAKPKDEMARKSCYSQLSLFNRSKKAIEYIPYDFRYKFFCHNEPSCPGHNYSIIDWEIGQAYRDWRMKYKSQDLLLEKIKERWLTRMCPDKNDVFFFVGNMKRFRDNFMILGVFYPPKVVQ
ncbi:hypothetical protein KAX35_00650 [candidate division WOR-3 bacterium]|nr:hypothetical protein [candidate division WOR-3 bacterium]